MLSDKGIKDYISKGMLKVEPLGGIGPVSIDLHIGNQLYRSNYQAHLLYQEETDRLSKENPLDFIKRLEESSQPFDEYVSRFGIPVLDSDGRWILEPNRMYYAQSDETITIKRNTHVKIATRSSSARIGLRVQYSEDTLDRCEAFEGKPFLVLQSYGTHVELPKNYSVCQMVAEPFRHLFDGEIEEAVKNGDVTISKKPVIGYDSIILSFHPRILRYNGRSMNPTRDNSECFEEVDITHGYVIEPRRFYLASTQEVVGIGSRYVGVLDEMSGWTFLHLNAPYHWPGSNHNITLEIFSTQPTIIKAGNPACRLFIEKLYPECEFLYNSKYSNQEGPTTGRSHL